MYIFLVGDNLGMIEVGFDGQVDGEVDETLVKPHVVIAIVFFRTISFLIIAFLVLWLFIRNKEDVLYGNLIHLIQQLHYRLVLGQVLQLGRWIVANPRDDQIPNQSLQVQWSNPAELLLC